MQEEIFCPLCDDITEHAVIKTGRERLVRCEVCGTVQTVEQERTRLASLRVIVSREDESQRYQIELPADENLKVGDDLLVDDGINEVVSAQITSIETERRVDQARAEEIKTLWARAVDEVAVKVSVHSKDKTTSHVVYAFGEDLFAVGEVRMADRTRFRVDKIKLRNGRFARRAEAKDILRMWGRRL